MSCNINKIISLPLNLSGNYKYSDITKFLLSLF